MLIGTKVELAPLDYVTYNRQDLVSGVISFMCFTASHKSCLDSKIVGVTGPGCTTF